MEGKGDQAKTVNLSDMWVLNLNTLKFQALKGKGTPPLPRSSTHLARNFDALQSHPSVRPPPPPYPPTHTHTFYMHLDYSLDLVQLLQFTKNEPSFLGGCRTSKRSSISTAPATTNSILLTFPATDGFVVLNVIFCSKCIKNHGIH